MTPSIVLAPVVVLHTSAGGPPMVGAVVCCRAQGHGVREDRRHGFRALTHAHTRARTHTRTVLGTPTLAVCARTIEEMRAGCGGTVRIGGELLGAATLLPPVPAAPPTTSTQILHIDRGTCVGCRSPRAATDIAMTRHGRTA